MQKCLLIYMEHQFKIMNKILNNLATVCSSTWFIAWRKFTAKGHDHKNKFICLNIFPCYELSYRYLVEFSCELFRLVCHKLYIYKYIKIWMIVFSLTSAIKFNAYIVMIDFFIAWKTFEDLACLLINNLSMIVKDSFFLIMQCHKWYKICKKMCK